MLARLSRGIATSARSPVRVRFAPSPTGQLHVGGLRTALFNYLFMRRNGGSFILRIEDTDRSRFVPGATEKLEAALKWAGIVPTEGPDSGPYGPYRQSERLDLYTMWAERLVKQGLAYRDFRPPTAETDARTSALLKEAYLPPSEDEAQELIARGERHVVRLKMDPRRTYKFDDLVYGHMEITDSAGMDDPIILKSDGWPTYHLASVVDDSAMKITHVLRGEEWLPSMPKHLALYEALGVAPPQFAHLPLLINPDGTKLSKRSGDVTVEEYRTKGFEPEALVNLVALTGYNYKDSEHESDVRSMDQLAEAFDIARISHSRATLPMAKLPFLNRHHLADKMADPDTRAEIIERLRAALDAAGMPVASDEQLLGAAQLAQQRTDTLEAIPLSAPYLFVEPDWRSAEAAKFIKNVPRETLTAVLTETHQWLGENWSSDIAHGLHELLVRLGDQVQGGRVAAQKSLRYALTASRAGPPVGDIVQFLGKERSMQRIHSVLNS
ncbi:glutamate--tRNA ligase [Malassezia cuniculi]|uniref:Glutamate--tRNA ligase, mitochondrial n=1 Tax=Malassezia cuniculi TaxID=948313 RepID=A0AAF0EUR1_9BASI|nr:glutamate--tRNA ligase [Malassezia cuniculi]